MNFIGLSLSDGWPTGRGTSEALALTPLLARTWKTNSTLASTLSDWLQSDAGRAWQKERERIFQDPDEADP